jgi:hypothetical protein
MVVLSKSRFIASLLLTFFVTICAPAPGSAAELDGVWATSPEACQSMFVKRGNEISFSEKADFYGSGFIFSGNTIRGKIAVCKIQSTKQRGATKNIKATCATDISVSTNNFALRKIDDNKLVRSILGVPELDTTYVRCP